MNLVYNVGDKPKFNKLLVFALQQVLAVMAATIAVPTIIGLPTQIPAAILGAGVGTIVYLLFTKFKSPVVISSSFAFLAPLCTAISFGYCGIIVGGILAGLVYVVLAIIIHFAGTKWVSKLMPPVIIGPTVALIGLSLAGSAMGDFTAASGLANLSVENLWAKNPVGITNSSYNLIAVLCALATFVTIIICSTQKKYKGLRLIPFITGIGVGYALASFFSIFGYACDVDYLKIINWGPIVKNFVAANGEFAGVTAFLNYPDFALIEAIKELANGQVSEAIIESAKSRYAEAGLLNGAGVAQVAIAFIPVAFVVFAEHIADHKNLGSIIGKDLVGEEPGLKRTLLGDGVGSMAGTVFGICPNTTYGESVGCVAITRNASVRTIFVAAIMCIVLSFLSPIMAILQTIPRCVMGGVCLTLYGFIAVSGLKMFKDIDLGDNKNLFTVSAILISGIGGLSLKIPYELYKNNVFGPALNEDATEIIQVITHYAGEVKSVITITSIATALILGICTYAICNAIEKKNKANEGDEKAESIITAPVEADSTYDVGANEEDK